MNVHLTTTVRKLNLATIKQLDEALLRDMRFICENGGVLGYINPVVKDSHRVFLLVNEKNDYIKLTNFPWEDSADGFSVIARLPKGKSTKRTFVTQELREEFKQYFQTIKRVAEKTHIYL